jgi:hypothetical protein
VKFKAVKEKRNVLNQKTFKGCPVNVNTIEEPF